jgi:hypothetical protein
MKILSFLSTAKNILRWQKMCCWFSRWPEVPRVRVHQMLCYSGHDYQLQTEGSTACVSKLFVAEDNTHCCGLFCWPQVVKLKIRGIAERIHFYVIHIVYTQFANMTLGRKIKTGWQWIGNIKIYSKNTRIYAAGVPEILLQVSQYSINYFASGKTYRWFQSHVQRVSEQDNDYVKLNQDIKIVKKKVKLIDVFLTNKSTKTRKVVALWATLRVPLRLKIWKSSHLVHFCGVTAPTGLGRLIFCFYITHTHTHN